MTGSNSQVSLRPKIPHPRKGCIQKLPPRLQNSVLGRVVDRTYRINSKIATGGMSTVYLARHVRTGEPVAIKVLRQDMGAALRLGERLLIEMQALQLIDHPAIVKTHSLGTLEDGRMYLIMEYVCGPPLRRLLKHDRQIQLSLAFHIIEDVARGLSEAHQNGVFHRDLKPANILLPQDLPGRQPSPVVAKIVDFGLARIANTPRITATDQVMGTPQYVSPEQAAGKPFDHRVDIYSLGIMMYEIFTGTQPFRGNNPNELLKKHVLRLPIPMRKIQTSTRLPRKLDKLVMSCLEKHPGDRPQHMSEVIASIEKIRRRMGISRNGVA